MKKLCLAVVAMLGMSFSMVVPAHGLETEKEYKDTYSHNIQHIYDPSSQ